MVVSPSAGGVGALASGLVIVPHHRVVHALLLYLVLVALDRRD